MSTIAYHRLRDGCQMCGDAMIDDHPNGTWVSKPGIRHVSLDNFSPTGGVQTIHVPVCGECYLTLATPEGINALTQAVNG